MTLSPLPFRLCVVLAVVAGVGPVHAQEAAVFDAPYELLSLDETQTRVLANRRALFLDPGRYDGSRESEALLPLQWEVLYGQMRTAAASVRVLPAPSTLAHAAAIYRARRQLPVAVFWQPFDFIDQNAVDSGLFQVDESGPTPRLYRPEVGDGEEVRVNPYQQASVFAASPLYGDDVSAALRGPVGAGGAITLILPRSLFVLPVGYARPAQVVVSAGTEVRPQTVALDEPFALTFLTAGVKTVRITATVGAATRQATFQLRVREAQASSDPVGGIVGASAGAACRARAQRAAWHEVVCGVEPRASNQWEPRLRYKTVAEHYLSRRAAAYDYGVVLSPHNATGRLRKPIILVGGYDSMEDAGLDDIYQQIVRFDNPETTGPNVEMDQALLDAGYDLVVMDFADSHDFIQRNGLALVDLIGLIHGQLDQNPQADRAIPAVIGYSMGGLVARYALAHLEKVRIPHRVGLFVSWDTPHQGALMPVGLEALLADLYSVVDKVLDVSALYASSDGGPDFVERRLYGPALQQLLTFWAGDNVNATDPDAVRTEIRRDLYNDFMALGDYPSQLRRVAISNGNAAGQRQIKGPMSGSHRMQPGEQTLLVEAGLSVLWGAFGTRIELRVQNAPTPGGTSQVYRRRDIVRFLGVPVYNTTQENTMSLPNPYDIVPGSYTETYSVIEKRASGRDTRESLLGTLAFTWLGAGAYYRVRVDANRHAFVPTASALDWNTRDWTREALVANTFRAQDLEARIRRTDVATATPFDAILTADDPYFPSGVGLENQPHLFVTEGVEAFVLDQLGRAAPNRSAPYVRATVTGPSNATGGTAATWSALPRGGTAPFTYYWTWAYTCASATQPDRGPYVSSSSCDTTPRDGGTADRMTVQFPGQGTVLVALAITDAAGQATEAFQTVNVQPGTPEAMGIPLVNQEPDAPVVFDAHIAPNPVQGRAKLRVDLPERADVVAEVYDTLGRLVLTAAQGSYGAGTHALAVDAGGLPVGTYVYRVRAGAEVASGTFTVAR